VATRRPEGGGDQEEGPEEPAEEEEEARRGRTHRAEGRDDDEEGRRQLRQVASSKSKSSVTARFEEAHEVEGWARQISGLCPNRLALGGLLTAHDFTDLVSEKCVAHMPGTREWAFAEWQTWPTHLHWYFLNLARFGRAPCPLATLMGASYRARNNCVGCVL